MKTSPLKVLYVDHVAYIGGAEISLLGLLRELLQSGALQPVVLLPEDGVLVKELIELGIDVRIISCIQLNVTLNPFSLLAYIYNLMRFNYYVVKMIKSENFDLIHANSIKAGILIGLAAKICEKPLVWHIRDFYPDGWVPLFVKIWGKVFASWSIAISERVASMLGTQMRKSIIYNGVDVATFTPSTLPHQRNEIRAELGLAPDVKLIGMVGQLTPWKRQDVFLAMAEKVVGQYENVHFVIVGDVYHQHDTAYRDQLLQFIRSHVLTDVVSFVGWRKDIVDVMAALDVLVHPAQEEPFGRVVIEAMAAGKPVVAVNSGGLPEIVVDGETGFLVPLDDPVSIASVIVQLIQNPDLCEAMGAYGRERAETIFSFEAHTAHVLHIYQNVLFSE